MKLISLNLNQLRPKVVEKISKYLEISEYNELTIGLYKNGLCYVFGDEEEQKRRLYDIGSITKTATAHLILKLYQDKKLDISKTIDNYMPLKKGKYPTIYQLLTHTAGYHHLTPAEITVPALLTHGYARKNIYENCTANTVIKCLHRRRFIKPKNKYGYSDFAFAILAIIAENVTQTPFSDLFEDFLNNDLGLKETCIEIDFAKRNPPAAQGKRLLPFWVWKRNNPYIAGGGMVSNIEDVLGYLKIQIESEELYIVSAHEVCETSLLRNNNHLMCIGWHTYKKSNQLWHVGGVGTFRSSVIVNKKLKLGVAVLGNAKGKASANVHYIAKMLYSELKNKRILK